jgi:anti-sigma-K factor RskA
LDTKQYIASGILELYVLDRLEPAARREVEANARLQPEIRNEINAIEEALEAFAVAAAPEVDPSLLDRIMAKPLPLVALPVDTPPADDTPKEKASTAPAVKADGSQTINYLAWGLAALALAAALYLFLRQSNLSTELEESTQATEQLQSNFNALETECAESRTALELNQALVAYLSDPATRDITLAGTANAPDKFAMVFYSPENNRTVFRGNNLPAPPTGKQYQLWAIDGDGPKSLAVLDLDLAGDALLEMDYLPGVAAFAITLEDLGGKPQPDLSQLQVIGEV